MCYLEFINCMNMAPSNNTPSETTILTQTLLLALISEELKSRRFFNTLQQLGLHDSCYQPHLDEIILECLGLNDGTNETFDFYCAVMDAGAVGIVGTRESVEREAGVVYGRLRGYRGFKV
jgi:hypothetical protein